MCAHIYIKYLMPSSFQIKLQSCISLKLQKHPLHSFTVMVTNQNTQTKYLKKDTLLT